MRMWNNLNRIGAMAVATFSGCTAAPRPAPITATPPPTSQPFVIPEAALPTGFPKPGPVGVVILKQYPACREARVDAPSDGQDSMFMSLFNHIKTNNISMTAPVEMTWEEPKPDQETRPVAMAFIYGQPTTGAVGTQGSVQVKDIPPQIVVSIGVRGGYNQQHLNASLNKLNDFLAVKPFRYRVVGPPRYLSYNSPFVPWFMKFGEVQLPVVEVK